MKLCCRPSSQSIVEWLDWLSSKSKFKCMMTGILHLARNAMHCEIDFWSPERSSRARFSPPFAPVQSFYATVGYAHCSVSAHPIFGALRFPFRSTAPPDKAHMLWWSYNEKVSFKWMIRKVEHQQQKRDKMLLNYISYMTAYLEERCKRWSVQDLGRILEKLHKEVRTQMIQSYDREREREWER